MGRRVKELPVPIDAVLQAALSPLLLLANTGCMDLAEREGEGKPTYTKSFLRALVCLQTFVALTPGEAE